MELSSRLVELQMAANYRWLQKTLRAGGIASIVFGGFALFSGLPKAGAEIASTGLAALGALLLLVGLFSALYPTPKGIIIDASAVILVGLWNVFTSMVNSRPDDFQWFVALGVFQVMWGVRRFGRYKPFSILKIEKPSKGLLRWMDNLAMLIFSAKPFEFGDVIAMQTDNGRKSIWKALISGDTAIFIEGIGDRMVFAARDDIHLNRLDASTSTDLANISIRFQDVFFTAVTPVQHIDRFEIWSKSLNEGDWAGFSGLKLAESVNWELVNWI